MRRLVSKAEVETVLRWDRHERIVTIYSSDPVTWRRCARLGIEMTRNEHDRDGAETGRFYRMALSDFRWSKKRRLDAAVRKAHAERLGAARKAKDGS